MNGRQGEAPKAALAEGGGRSRMKGLVCEEDFLKSIYNPLLAVDVEGRITHCNPGMEKVLGLSRETVLGQQIRRILPTSEMERVVRDAKAESAKTIRIGGRLYLTNRAPVVSGGRTVGAVAVLQDISDLEAISMELTHTRRLSEELNAIIESSFDGIFVTDGEGKTLRVNRAYERITGIRREEVLGYRMHELVARGYYDESVSLKVLETGQAESIVQTVKTGKTVMVTGTPIMDARGAISLVVTNVRDVTELSRLQEKLAEMDRSYSEQEIRLKTLQNEVRGGDRYIFVSPRMQAMKELGLRLAVVDSTVLIQGESGVGKEVFAEFIHEESPRREKPFIKISCAAIPEQLLESELFGYVDGAFTGARKRGKPGLFEAADGGTLFLDEVGELPLGLQAKLLRVLQERSITRLGDTRPREVDVRIMAATNRDMEQMVADREFRKDLFFRLNVVPVVLPPLRERRDAISRFVYHFLSRFNCRYGLSRQIAPEVLDLLVAYEWPGNVRELENMVERLVVTTRSDVIGLEDVPDALRRLKTRGWARQLEGRPLKEILEAVEQDAIERALALHGSTRKAAAALGIDQSSVVRKSRRYGIRKGGLQSD